MDRIINGIDLVLIKQLKLVNWDRGILAVTGFISYFSISVENLNLYLAVVLKCFAILNVLVYLLLNHKRIATKLRRLLGFKKK
tara:strand:- start:1021 stop:1269 length:249 start_codon:yes stop_codon:yes gene_type:complete